MLLYDFMSSAGNSLCGKNRASFNSAICNENKQHFLERLSQECELCIIAVGHLLSNVMNTLTKGGAEHVKAEVDTFVLWR